MVHNTEHIHTNQYFLFIGSVYCTYDESNPTPVYVVQDSDAVLHCGFESSRLSWGVYNGGSWNTIAVAFDITDKTKYNVSTNSAGLYYRLHILNVGVSDVKKYACEAVSDGVIQTFFLKLDLLGRCNPMVLFNVVKHRLYDCWK